MDIKAKMQEKEELFNQLKESVIEREGRIKVINNEIIQITDEMKRIQGEFRILTEIGIETGVLEKEDDINLVEDEVEIKDKDEE